MSSIISPLEEEQVATGEEALPEEEATTTETEEGTEEEATGEEDLSSTDAAELAQQVRDLEFRNTQLTNLLAEIAGKQQVDEQPTKAKAVEVKTPEFDLSEFPEEVRPVIDHIVKKVLPVAAQPLVDKILQLEGQLAKVSADTQDRSVKQEVKDCAAAHKDFYSYRRLIVGLANEPRYASLPVEDLYQLAKAKASPSVPQQKKPQPTQHTKPAAASPPTKPATRVKTLDEAFEKALADNPNVINRIKSYADA